MNRAVEIAGLAIATRRLERIKTAMRKPCEVQEPERHEVGDAGIPPCWMEPDNPDSPPCPRCAAKIAEWNYVRPLLRAARRRLRAAIDREI